MTEKATDNASAVERSVRVFIGVSEHVPASVATGGPVATSGVVVHSVTQELASRLPDHDEEHLEYEALWEAAETCAGRVIVAAADVSAAALGDAPSGAADSARRLMEDIAAGALVSWHLALDDDEEDDELSWFDATETPTVADLVRGTT